MGPFVSGLQKETHQENVQSLYTLGRGIVPPVVRARSLTR